MENGGQQRKKNYGKALELYRRLFKEFKKGETRHDPARQRIKHIAQPVPGLHAANIFPPDSEVQFHLNWRNVKSIEYSAYPVNLTRDVKFADKKEASQWIQQINPALKNKILSRSEKTANPGGFHPGQKTVRLKKNVQRGLSH